METRAPYDQLTLSKEKSPFCGGKLPSSAQLGIPSMCAVDPKGDPRGGGGKRSGDTSETQQSADSTRLVVCRLGGGSSLELTEIGLLSCTQMLCLLNPGDSGRSSLGAGVSNPWDLSSRWLHCLLAKQASG